MDARFEERKQGLLSDLKNVESIAYRFGQRSDAFAMVCGQVRLG